MGLIGAHLHSRFLEPSGPADAATLNAIVAASGAEVVAFGAPLSTAAGRERAPQIVAQWLDADAGVKALPVINTFALPREAQDEEGIRDLFAAMAPAFSGRPSVLAVAGANEPLTQGRRWRSVDDAEERVRLEHRLWHETSDLPFCHKFTNPRINVAGADWALLETFWTESQDAICYDWYEANGDTVETARRLQALGDRLGKPVYIMEIAVLGNSVATFLDVARHVDAVVLYQLLATENGHDERFAAYSIGAGGEVRARPPAALIAAPDRP